MNKTPHWEDLVRDAQQNVRTAIARFDTMQEQIHSLEADIEQLKTIIEYLEIKLGINDSV